MFVKIDIAKESELEHLVMKEPDALERGLRILTHQRRAHSKFRDILATDAEGVLVVIELKTGEDDGMLLQALEYYDYISVNRDRLEKEFQKVSKINIEEDPRIILVASSFSERIKKAARYITPEIYLMEYSYLESKAAERGLVFKEVAINADSGYAPPTSLESVLDYISEQELRALCEKVHNEIIKRLPNVEVIPRRHEIHYKCMNRSLGGLALRKQLFYPWWRYPDKQEWQEAVIAKKDDWAKKREKVLKGFEARYRAYGGD
jgi:Endonuclease NucS